MGNPVARIPESSTTISSTTGATFFGWYARLTQEMLGGSPWSVSRKTAFHCTNRAGGQVTASPAEILYGPAHALQLSSGVEVLPERT